MINAKDKVYGKLCSVCDNVTDVYPGDWENLPAIQYTEEENTIYQKVDGAESMSKLRYRIDIWDNKSTTAMSIAVDEVMSELGLNRVTCSDVEDPSRRRHKLMRYEGVIDNETELVYWDGSR